MTKENLPGVRENGTVEGCYVETYYAPCEYIMNAPELLMLKVTVDDGGTNIETRVPYEWLINLGWTPPPPGQ